MTKTTMTKPKTVIIASEKMTVHKSEWNEVPPQHIVAVDAKKSIQLLVL